MFLIILAWMLFTVLPAAFGQLPLFVGVPIVVLFGIGMHAFVWGFVVELL